MVKVAFVRHRGAVCRMLTHGGSEGVVTFVPNRDRKGVATHTTVLSCMLRHGGRTRRALH